MTVLQNTFEALAVGTALTAGSGGNTGGASGDYFPALNNSGGSTLVVDNTHVHSGTKSLKLTPVSGQAAACRWGTGLASSSISGYMWFYFTAAPTGDERLIRIDNASGTRIFTMNYTAGKLRACDNSTVLDAHNWESAAAVPLNGWVRIAWWITNFVTGAGHIRCAYYNGDSTTPIESFSTDTASLGTALADAVYMGKYSNGVYATAFWLDDPKVDTAATALLQPPGSVVANAGPDLTDIEPFTTVALDGTATTGATSYAWTASASGGETITLTGATTATPSYVAPATVDGTVITFTLTVNGTATDTVVHAVDPWPLWMFNGTIWNPIVEKIFHGGAWV